jgi:hypothetical protein
MLTGRLLAIPWVLVLLLISLLASACISSIHKIYASPPAPPSPGACPLEVMSSTLSFLVSSVSTQICVGVSRSKDSDGFIRVSSGKKRGLVPADSLAEI